MKADINELVSQMTLQEKASMCSGADFWHTDAIERLGIPAIMVTDGPHGLRRQEKEADHLGLKESVKAVCFPSGCTVASSFSKQSLYDMGVALGKECQAENVAILLGPSINIKRSPLCGRNFEYFSEDPFLAGKLAASYISGMKSQHVGTAMKHYAANNQEYRRMSSSSNVDERTLREIYLIAFEMAVKEVEPWSIMSSYNKVNGVFASENKKLLTDILRNEWGFKGFVLSDWGGVNDRVSALNAGLDLEMPSSNKTNDEKIIDAVNSGIIPIETLNNTVKRIITVAFEYVENHVETVFDFERDHEIACQIECDSIVLLKNEGILPLQEKQFTEKQKLAFIGEYAKTPRYQGGGSSYINSYKVVSALDAAKGIVDVTYAQGYITETDETNEALLEEAVRTAKDSAAVVLFVGLPDSFESEGYDRDNLNMPNCQNELIEKICEVQDNVIVVLHNGSPVLMPWLNKVKAVVETYLGGQAVGQAVTDILFGKVNPSGRLAETFPLRLEDTPCYCNYPGNGVDADYNEGIFVGYRWYDKRKMDVLFPFGYGLSYTEFEYSNLSVDKKLIHEGDILTVSVDVTNIGSVTGKEVVQLYVSDRTEAAVRPDKELKGFEKIELSPGETKRVTMELNQRSFAWYNIHINDWYCGTGTYEIQIGKSSRDIVLTTEITLIGIERKKEYTANTLCGELISDPEKKALIQKYIANFEVSMTPEGEVTEITKKMTDSLLDNWPIRSLRGFSTLTNDELEKIVEQLNKN